MKSPAPAARPPIPGIVRALALTSSGAVAAHVECMLLSGRGRLILTGNLVGAARDSAQVALSLARSRALRLGVDPADFLRTDVHFHVAESLPAKDGPSAGLPLFIALISAMARVPVDSTLAFTGEISLSGLVHAVDGLQEKAAAARRAGLQTLCVPAENTREIGTAAKKPPRGLKIVSADHVDAALKIAFGKLHAERAKTR